MSVSQPGYNHIDDSDHGLPFRQGLRRLREDPIEAVEQIALTIGPRRATSLEEAQAAAYVDARLRRAGLRVSADPFLAPASVGCDGIMLGVLALLCFALFYWQPLPALALACWGTAMSLWRLRHPEGPLLSRRRSSQNVIGTRAVAQVPRWRVVLLAPLESPLRMGPLTRWLGMGDRAVTGRAIAYLILTCCALAALSTRSVDIQRLWWYAQALPTAYLLLLAAIEVSCLRAPATPGAINHAGALATLLTAAEELNDIRSVELWVVALGSSSTGAGMLDLRRRYPFEHDRTLFVSLEGIGSGNLAFVTREGSLQTRPADPLLLRLAMAVDADDSLINVEPRPYRSGTTIAGALRRDSWRSLAIVCLTPEGCIPYYGRADDTPQVVEAELLNRAVRLVTGLVRRIEALPPDTH